MPSRSSCSGKDDLDCRVASVGVAALETADGALDGSEILLRSGVRLECVDPDGGSSVTPFTTNRLISNLGPADASVSAPNADGESVASIRMIEQSMPFIGGLHGLVVSPDRNQTGGVRSIRAVKLPL